MASEPGNGAGATDRRWIGQLGRFCVATGVLAATVALTRGRMARHMRVAAPQRYNHVQPALADGAARDPVLARARDERALLGAEALALASLNVAAAAAFAALGLAWALDVSAPAELSARLRRLQRRPGGSGRVQPDPQAEQEVEQWAAGVLASFSARDVAKPETADPQPEAGERTASGESVE